MACFIFLCVMEVEHQMCPEPVNIVLLDLVLPVYAQVKKCINTIEKLWKLQETVIPRKQFKNKKNYKERKRDPKLLLNA